MIKYQLFNPQELEANISETFLSFITPNVKDFFLEKMTAGSFSLAVAAYDDQKLIGLAFGQAHPILEQGTIYSLFVAEKMRRQGIGTALLDSLVKAFLQKKIPFLQLRFYSNNPSSEYLKKILEKLEWKPPQIIVDRYYFYAPTFEADWYLANVPVLPKDLRISPWQYLSEKQISSIRKLIKSNPILEDLSPFGSKLPIENLNSLVLKRKNHILGWLITHRYNNNTIRYSALYVDRELRGYGPAVCLLKEAIRRQKASTILDAFTEVNRKRTPLYWRQFVKKRLEPNTTHIDSTFFSYYHKDVNDGISNQLS